MMPSGNLQRMTPARYIMVGGFLGAGKTTAILRMAERCTASGRRVGLITNDQSVGLVDTTCWPRTASRSRRSPAAASAAGSTRSSTPPSG